jgi:hypothetical protein
MDSKYYWRFTKDRPKFKRVKDLIHIEGHEPIQFCVTDFKRGRGWEAEVYFFWPGCGCKYETKVVLRNTPAVGSVFYDVTLGVVYIYTEAVKEYDGKCPICSAVDPEMEQELEEDKPQVVGCLRLWKGLMDYSTDGECEDLKVKKDGRRAKSWGYTE